MLLVRGGTVVNADGTASADVLIDGERVVAVGPDLDPTGCDVLDAGGALVVPGAIDAHTHLDLPVGAVRSADDFESGTIAAACGGTTCVVDFAGAGREEPDEALREWHTKAEGRAVVDYGFHLTLTSVPEDPQAASAVFRWFVSRGVTSVKLYLAYPERLMVDEATLRRAMVAAGETGVLVCVHAEDGLEAERRTGEQLEAGEKGPSALLLARPPEIEAAAVRTAGDLARETGSAVYVVHLSSALGLEAVREARANGAQVLAETCPQYLFLTDAELGRPAEEAQDFVCIPPVRADADREALWTALADGELDTVSTDHCPFTTTDRRHGTVERDDGWLDFTEIPGGLPGVETRLSLLYQGVVEERLSAERWIALLAAAPARLFGLADRKGAIAPGMDADIVVFDPSATRRLDASSLHMRTDHSPYADRTVSGWPAITISRGEVVATDGEPTEVAPGRGRFVPRSPSTAPR
jgi:dihydropyrimidinase